MRVPHDAQFMLVEALILGAEHARAWPCRARRRGVAWRYARRAGRHRGYPRAGEVIPGLRWARRGQSRLGLGCAILTVEQPGSP